MRTSRWVPGVPRIAEQAIIAVSLRNKNEEKIQPGMFASDEIPILRDKWDIMRDKGKKIRLCEQSRLPL